MARALPGIVDLIKRCSQNQTFSCNVGIPYKGKDRIAAPIPFQMKVYVVERPGDSSVRLMQGDAYGSGIKIYSLAPISVLSGTPPLSQYVTFGFLDTHFTLLYGMKTYRITTQRSVEDQYYELDGELSV